MTVATGFIVNAEANDWHSGRRLAFRQRPPTASATIKLYGRMRRPRTGLSTSLELQLSRASTIDPRSRVKMECRAVDRVRAWHLKPPIG